MMFGEARPMLGSMKMTNLQPRGGSAMLPRPAAGDGMEQSHAGFGQYLDEQTAGSPRRMGGGRRAGARFTEGPMRGKTADQAKIGLREAYAKMSPEEKAKYEAKARFEDISTPVPGTPAAAAPAAPAATAPAPLEPEMMDLDDDEDLTKLAIKPMLPRRTAYA
jgi:hypothetical protein